MYGLDMHFIVGIIKEVQRPTDNAHTATVELINGDTIENVPFMLPIGTNEARYGYIMVDVDVEVLLIKRYGSDWLIIGEVSQSRVAMATSQKEQTQSQITSAITTIKEAFEDTMDIAKALAKNQGNVAKALYSASAGLKQTGTSVAGSPSTPLSNASSIVSSAVAVGGYATQVQLSSIQTRVDIQTFLAKYPPLLEENVNKQEEQFETND